MSLLQSGFYIDSGVEFLLFIEFTEQTWWLVRGTVNDTANASKRSSEEII